MGQFGDQSAHQQSRGDNVVSDVWATTADESVEAADDCGPTRVCRNARDFTFDGIAEEGEDLRRGHMLLHGVGSGRDQHGPRAPDLAAICELDAGPGGHRGGCAGRRVTRSHAQRPDRVLDTHAAAAAAT